MEKRYLGQDIHELILGEKLTGFVSAKSINEKNKQITLAKQWIKENPNKHINFY